MIAYTPTPVSHDLADILADADRQLARAHIVTLTTGQWGTVTAAMDDLRAQVAQLQSRGV